MIDRLGTWGESHSRRRGETLQCSSSVNKQQEALLGAAKGMQCWLWQLSPQGGGLSHKLIERSHMIGEFHLEPSRYIKPHRNEEFTEVPLHFPKSPQITCVIVTPLPTAPPPMHLSPWNSWAKLCLCSSWFNYHNLLSPFFFFSPSKHVTHILLPFWFARSQKHEHLSYTATISDDVICNIFNVKRSTKESRESYKWWLKMIKNWKHEKIFYFHLAALIYWPTNFKCNVTFLHFFSPPSS